MESSLVIIKPDGVQRRLIGRVITRFEEKGLTIRGMKMMRVSSALAGEHYAEHKKKPFFKGLVEFITSAPVVVMVIQGVDAVAVVRGLVGATNGREAAPGTIRGDHGMSLCFNVVHASDSSASARREVALYFTRNELVGVPPADYSYIYENRDGSLV
ncbi:MAG: nucleoside-diphosphate kinase [Planctomycetes bacterium]|nr:nucleoside-diphosphate kinase [Planctomycetota bacterium]